jgi:Zn-dependent protease
VSDLLVLVPEHGEPVALSRAAWEATVDFLADHEAFHESLLEAWRRAPGVVVSDLQATRMAGLADHEADDPDTDPGDRDGLSRLATFCRGSGGFLVAGPEAMPAPAPPPEPVEEPLYPVRPPDPDEPPEPPAWHARARRMLGPFAVVLIFAVKWIAKLKILLVALPKIGFLKVALLGATNLWFYALFWGWQIAAYVIVLLLVHELGHAIAYKAFGLGVARIGFVPFLGAYAMSKTAPESAWVNALCALAGPFVGGVGCAVLWWYGHTTGSDLMSAAATLGFLLNLFNMVPVVPFDGGVAAGAIHPYVWFVGIFGLTLAALRFPNVILFLFLGIALWQAYRLLKRYRAGDEATLRFYRSVTPRQRIVIALLYFGISALLAAGFFEAAPPRPQ